MRKVVIQIMIFLVFVGSSSAANYATEVASDRPVTWIRFEGNDVGIIQGIEKSLTEVKGYAVTHVHGTIEVTGFFQAIA